MSQDFWLGVVAIPLFTAAGVALFYAIIGARFLAGKAFGKLLRSYKPVRYGGDAGNGFRFATDFGVRSTFAAIALNARKMWLFEPFNGFAVFVMLSRPKEHTQRTRRLKAEIEKTYDELLDDEVKP